MLVAGSNLLGNNLEENKLILRQRSPSTSSSSSSLFSRSSSRSFSCTKCNSDDSKNRELEDCNPELNNIISLNADIHDLSLENKTKENKVS
ncbi:unnamed protein product, partial [Brenthis ino]